MAARDLEGGGTGSAHRRRERRLRSMLRHERLVVAMALAETLRHSAQRVMEQHTALRGQKTASAWEVEARESHSALRGQKQPPPGGSLLDPRPQRSDRTVRRSAGDGLLQLAVPSLASPGSEAVDSSALSFLVWRAEDWKKVEEEEEARKKAMTVARAVSSSIGASGGGLTPAQQAELEEARAEVRREAKVRSNEVHERRKKNKRATSCRCSPCTTPCRRFRSRSLRCTL